MPGKGLGLAAKRIAEAASKKDVANPKMKMLKGKIAPLKKMKSEEIKKTPKQMPLDGAVKSMPKKGDKPEFMKPGYKAGSILRGYTKYA